MTAQPEDDAATYCTQLADAFARLGERHTTHLTSDALGRPLLIVKDTTTGRSAYVTLIKPVPDSALFVWALDGAQRADRVHDAAAALATWLATDSPAEPEGDGSASPLPHRGEADPGKGGGHGD